MKLFNFKKRVKPEDQIKFKEYGFKDGEIHAVMQHPGFVNLTEGLVEMFKESGGINYVEVSTYHPDLGFFDVIVQRKQGKTPAQVNSELREEIEKIKKESLDQRSRAIMAELRIGELQDENSALLVGSLLLKEMADYLNRNDQNYIGSGSVFNWQMNELLKKSEV